ncbi:MAG: hypothetical protein VX529_13510 [Pseudomonadota bacterium]|nr:hypothetical protein [Pseudomonadota bacterium]
MSWVLTGACACEAAAEVEGGLCLFLSAVLAGTALGTTGRGWEISLPGVVVMYTDILGIESNDDRRGIKMESIIHYISYVFDGSLKSECGILEPVQYTGNWRDVTCLRCMETKAIREFTNSAHGGGEGRRSESLVARGAYRGVFEFFEWGGEKKTVEILGGAALIEHCAARITRYAMSLSFGGSTVRSEIERCEVSSPRISSSSNEVLEVLAPIFAEWKGPHNL